LNCRHCKASLDHTFINLGFAPPSNAYLTEADLNLPEKYYPLRVKVCDECWLVQTEDYARADELFSSEYAYFSSTSSSWVAHAAEYVKKIINKLNLTRNSLVIEIASNDGYLLKNFIISNIPCIGIEPTASTADQADKLGIPVIRQFFDERLGNQLANEGKLADLIIGNNVYAHVPDINDFTRGLKAVLKPNGTITLEFPHLMKLIKCNQFDTIYHEHFSYLSIYTIMHIFASAGLRIWDLEELPTHGGSVRVYGCHAQSPQQTTPAVAMMIEKEKQFGLQKLATYQNFQVTANRIKDELVSFLIQQKSIGNKVAAYGAAAKGNTLLNYAGIRPDLLPYICDAATAKQGKFMPGSLIPILAPSIFHTNPPDWILILPWNIADEVMDQLKVNSLKNTKFLIAVPELKVL